MTYLADVPFKSLNAGQKFETYDTAATFEKRNDTQAYCAVFAPAGWFSFAADEVVRAYTGVCFMEGQ